MGRDAEELGEDLVNMTVQLGTGGIASFEDGEFSADIDDNFTVRTMDRITGHDIAEKQLKQQEAAVAREEERREKMLEADRMQQERRARMASGRAAAIRGSRRGSQAGTGGVMGDAIGGERDFLGL